jgi:hypothetical protein
MEAMTQEQGRPSHNLTTHILARANTLLVYHLNAQGHFFLKIAPTVAHYHLATNNVTNNL